MKISIIFKPDDVLNELYLRVYRLIKEHKWKWQSVGAFAALCGGFSAPFIAVLLDIISWFTQADSLKIATTKTSMGLYVITLPLLFFGSHCLDLLEKKSSMTSAENRQADELDLGLKA